MAPGNIGGSYFVSLVYSSLVLVLLFTLVVVGSLFFLCSPVFVILLFGLIALFYLGLGVYLALSVSFLFFALLAFFLL